MRDIDREELCLSPKRAKPSSAEVFATATVAAVATWRAQMSKKYEETYNLNNADLSSVLAAERENENDIDKQLLKPSAVEKLSTENSRLGDDTTKVFPESPWYRVLVTVVCAGILVGTLILLW